MFTAEQKRDDRGWHPHVCEHGYPHNPDTVRRDSKGNRYCYPCAKARSKAWRLANPDKTDRLRKAWIAANPEKYKETQRKASKKHRDANAHRTFNRHSANVLELTGQDKIDAAFARVRATGRINSFHDIIVQKRWAAIRHFHPALAAEMDRVMQQARIDLGGGRRTRLWRETKHLIVAKPAIIKRAPALTGIIAGPSNEIFETIQQIVPRYLDFDRRKDVISAMVLAVLEGELRIENARSACKAFITESYRQFTHKGYGSIQSPLSLDAPIHFDSKTSHGETVTEGLWA